MTPKEYTGGENFDLRDALLLGHKLNVRERVKFFAQFIDDLQKNNQCLYRRRIDGATGREVLVIDETSGLTQTMLMFGSNNYLGLANHPHVKEYVQNVIGEYGVGVGGPPLLNGYTTLHHTLEKRLSSFKKKEDTIIFSSGYSTNIGILSALLNKGDIVLHDKYCHASFIDGLQMSKATSFHFEHNDVSHLELLLQKNASHARDLFVAVEGVYSMDGDLARLDEIVPLSKKYGALVILDDAHGTGVFGDNGRGTAEYFGVQDDVDITVGTFSKAFSVVGGFVSASKDIINYLRFFARSYMFSASLPPPTLAAVLAGLDILEHEATLIEKLHDNIAYAKQMFKEIGFDISTISPIIALIVPVGMNIREAAYHFHKKGIFVNSIEYPAVPVNQQRFRISLMATHTKKDIDTLVACVDEVWHAYRERQMEQPVSLNI